MNSHNPSEAITMNLCSELIKLFTFFYLKFYDLRLANYTNFWGHHITEWTSHCKSWNVLCLHPYSIRTHLLPIFIKIWCNSSSINDDSLSLNRILSFMVLGKRLCSPFFAIPTEDNSPWITQIWAINFILMNVS